MTEKQPYEGKNGFIIAYAVVSQGLRPTAPVQAEALFKTLWHADPNVRPEAKDIVIL